MRGEEGGCGWGFLRAGNCEGWDVELEELGGGGWGGGRWDGEMIWDLSVYIRLCYIIVAGANFWLMTIYKCGNIFVQWYGFYAI